MMDDIAQGGGMILSDIKGQFISDDFDSPKHYEDHTEQSSENCSHPSRITKQSKKIKMILIYTVKSS